MNYLKVCILFILFFCSTFAQEDATLLNLMNICRTQPKEFLNDYVLPYLESHKEENTNYAKSLIRELKSMKPISPLKETSDLRKMASDYATNMGIKGFIGHKQTDARFKANSIQYEFIGENCSYGFNQSMDILMQLLIDEDESDLGHRKNILNHNFQYIGIAIAPHKKLTWNCVMEFGGTSLNK